MHFKFRVYLVSVLYSILGTMLDYITYLFSWLAFFTYLALFSSNCTCKT